MDTLILDEDIDISEYIPPFMADDIDSLYTIYNNPAMHSEFPDSNFSKLHSYFEGVVRGWNPMETFIDPTLLEISTDTSELNIFIEQLKAEFDRRKTTQSNY